MDTPCSLEHCHTNLFALQNLKDMKWKCFRRTMNYRLENNHSGRPDNYKDPVLQAYWNALHADVLCAWKRVLTDDGQKIERELWLFGISEDLPSDLLNLRAMTKSHGSCSETSMSYDCRTMLFKALHNMIEKYLLSKGFARLNKWFVLPVNGHSDVKVPNFSFNFHFFLHGDNKVCASIDVQRHQHIFNLTAKDLEGTIRTNVILAPYGINGMLIGPVNREIDLTAIRDNWEKNYPIRHFDGLSDFVEVLIGNARMFYPTCYVYKIGTNDPPLNSNETNSTNKKSEIATTKKSKSTTVNLNPSLRSTSNTSKIESALIKDFANNLLISAQRNNCIDFEKRPNECCSIVDDAVNHQVCRCHQPLSNNTRMSPFIPFHRRPRATPSTTSDSSIRNKVETTKIQITSESIENHEMLTESTSSPMISTHLQPTTNEKSTEWIASTPNSVGLTSSPSVLPSIPNQNSVSSNSPAPNQSSSTSSRGVKRSATLAFEETNADGEERERQRQTYDFNRTDLFLQLPLKRFRPETPFIRSRINSTADTPEHLYLHGQPTPPSPSQHTFRTITDIDEDDSVSRTNSPLVTTASNLPPFYPTTGPSMDDLITIIDSRDTTDNKTTNPITTADHNVKSPPRKDQTPLPPPPPPVPTISINNNIYPLNKPLNGVYHHEIEQIYNTPPGSSSSEKLQALHSPYAIIAEAAGHVANAFDTLNQFSQESIVTPFESNIVAEQSAYYPIHKLSIKKAEKRYEPKKSSSITISTRPKTFRHWKPIIPSNDFSSSPFSNQHLLRQQPTPTIYSPMRSVDVQPSPYLTRSVGSVQTVNSPLGNLPPSIPEIDSLILNVLLNDSILNLYRDINFDSCVLCACVYNELSIHGIDSMIYLEKFRESVKSTHPHGYSHDPSYPHSSLYSHHQQQQQAMNNRCSCGFSAVVNLRLSYSSGLFYEDEIEITGMKTDVKYRQTSDALSLPLLEFIERKESFPSPFDSFSRQNTSKKSTQDSLQILKQPFHQSENLACRLAIDQARNYGTTPLANDIDQHLWLHQWSYSASPLDSDQQLITMLRSLKPLLVEALKKRQVNGLWSTIDGPLTWKSFHQLLYAQKQHAHLEEQISGPQPIPYVLAGFDREWMTLAPYGLKFWDKLCLEPYSKRKDIGYLCLVPDNDYVCSSTKTYMRELSAHYELCRLGSHRPLLKAFPDQGLLRIASRTNESTPLPTIDPWFTDHENTHPLGSRLKLYAQIFKEKLSNLLSNQPFDNSNSDENISRRDVFRAPNDLSSVDLHSSNNDASNPNSSLSPSSSTLMPGSIYTTGSTSTDTSSLSISNGTSINGQQVDAVDLQAFESFYHGRSLNDEQLFLVIYLIDTFRYELTSTMSNENEPIDMDIYVKKAIFRAYMDLLKDLPEKVSMRIHIQIIPFESIVNHQVDSDSELRVTQYKRLSFHIYDQLRRTVSYSTRAKSLTGFGPAASEEKEPAKWVMQLYTPAYILSPKSDFRFKSFSDLTEQTNNNGSILYCSYCLSDDQRYLLASCSDDRGELLETCSINIEIPDRHRRKVQHARRIGLQKLWNFIMRIVTGTTMPWRIVVGRLGRLGHGELKVWGIILSKTNLVRCATLIRDSCPMCHILRSHDHPVILSACLISLETHPLLTILPESFELGEMRGAQPSNNTNNMQNTGQVLNDLSVTHILTLPTSASVQHIQPNTRAHGLQQLSMDLDEDLFGTSLVGFDTDLIYGMQSPPDLELPGACTLDLNHSGSINGGHLSRLNSLSTSQTNFNGIDPYGNSLNSSGMKSNPLVHPITDIDMNEIPVLHQQPLALGFYVSTIGTLNPLPIWMLQGRSHLQSNNSSSVFKATLHVSVPNAQHSDDMFFAQNYDQKSIHPLDSNYTYVVLRHVLESYHRLSWLLIDAKTNERASCLPIHLETLLRLYHAFIKFV